MYIHLCADGMIKKIWFIDDLPRGYFSAASFQRREDYIKTMVWQCKADAGAIIYECIHYEFYLVADSVPTDQIDWYTEKLDALFPDEK